MIPLFKNLAKKREVLDPGKGKKRTVIFWQVLFSCQIRLQTCHTFVHRMNNLGYPALLVKEMLQSSEGSFLNLCIVCLIKIWVRIA